MRLIDLKTKCQVLELNPNPTRNRINKETGERYLDFSARDYTTAIQEYYVSERKERGIYHKSLDYILYKLNMISPMLALQIKGIPEEKREDIWNNGDNWIAEEKIDGCRMNLCWFSEDNSLDAYSRNLSDYDCLPINYGDKLYDEIDTSSLNGFPNFIIDGELVLKSKSVNKGNEIFVADTQLSAVSAILSSNKELSKEFQKLNPVKLIVFDIIMYDSKDLTNLPLRERKKYLNIIYDKLKDIIDISLVPNGNGLDIRDFYNQVVSSGGEGLVVKDLNSTYDLKGKRAGEWVKIKRTVSGSLLESKYGDTLDAFVIGFHRGNGKNINKVGSLIFGMYLLDSNNNYILDNNGNRVIHEIAIVGGLDDALRDAITVYNESTDEVSLRTDVYGRVGCIDGQDVSSKQLRFSHAILLNWRNDKSIEQCSIRKDFLEALVL